MNDADGFTPDPFAPLSPQDMHLADGSAPAGAAGEVWQPIFPAPEEPPEANRIRHPKHGAAAARWVYRDEAGRPLFAAVRFDTTKPDGTEGKEVLPYTFGHRRWMLKSGKHAGMWRDTTGWCWKRPPTPVPIYGLDRLAARPCAPALVCEGEKKADAAAQLFPDTVAIASQGGSKAAGYTDWKSLMGRHMTVWPDHDKPGAAYAADVTARALAAGAASVRVVSIPKNWPTGWDLADKMPDGVRPERLRALLAEAVPAYAPAVLPDGFMFRDDGLWFHPTPTENFPNPSPIWVAAPFEVVGEAHDGFGNGWGVLLRWRDRDGVPHQWCVPKRLVHEQGNRIAAELQDAGLTCGVGGRAECRLKQFISGVCAPRKLRCVNRAGWHEAQGQHVFMLPGGGAFGPGADNVVMQAERVGTDAAFRTAGTLADWQREVAAYAVGNDRLVLFLASAFAGPLLDVMAEPSGGVHLVGQSQSGKSTATFVAGSVWGRGDRSAQVRPWRGTANGIEGVAAETSDIVLILDEIGQADPREVGEVIYMLANEGGKARAGRGGQARQRQTWRSLFLSTGELTLAAKMADVGKRAMAGLEVRLVNLPADAGAGLGVFQALHDKPTAAALADQLRDAARTHYGTAARPYLEQLARDRASDPDELRGFLTTLREGFLAQHVPVSAAGQVRSVASRFALIGAAGELARHYGVLPWPQGEAMRAAGACFAAWMTERGGAGAEEDAQAVSQVRAFIEQHGESRFTRVGDRSAEIDASASVREPRNTINRTGFKRLIHTDDGDQWEYMILPEAWKNEVCTGLNAKQVAKTLAARGLLKVEEPGRYQRKVRVEGHGRIRLYLVGGNILDVDAM